MNPFLEFAKKTAQAVTIKTLVGRAVEAVALITSAGGGFILKIAPPEETSVAYTVGVASIAALVIYILVLVKAHGRLKAKHRKIWFVVAVVFSVVFLVFAFRYNEDRDRLTFLWPPNESDQELKVAGDRFTPKAWEKKQNDPSLTSAQLVSGFGGLDARTKVWPEESIHHASTKLKVDYVIMFLSVATIFFCATEGILLRNPKTRK